MSETIKLKNAASGSIWTDMLKKGNDVGSVKSRTVFVVIRLNDKILTNKDPIMAERLPQYRLSLLLLYKRSEPKAPNANAKIAAIKRNIYFILSC